MSGRYLGGVWTLVWTLLGTARASLNTQRELALENLALRQQIGVLTRTLGDRRLRLGAWDRGFWVIVSQGWAGWKEALAIVQPATVIRWHRDGFRRFWTRRSRKQRPGRPGLGREIVSLIRRMSQANVTWGAPRIRSELAKLGIEVAVSTVAKYMLRRRGPPSSTWRCSGAPRDPRARAGTRGRIPRGGWTPRAGRSLRVGLVVAPGRRGTGPDGVLGKDRMALHLD
jgi:hypothetical protein